MVNSNVIAGIHIIAGFAQKIQDRLDETTQKLDLLTAEMNIMKAKREAREARKLKLKQRQKQRDKDPIMLEHYKALLSLVGTEMTVNKARRSLAFASMFVTGMHIGEFQACRFENIRSIFSNQRPSVRLQTLKRGPYTTAHLSKPGREIVKERQRDYMLILKYQGGDLNSLVLPNQKEENKAMSRSHVNREINAVIRELNSMFNGKFTSHSFRRGYITYLWEESGDIELVRQLIGYAKLETTSSYLKKKT